MNVQKQLAEFLYNLEYKYISQKDINEAKYRILDWIGSLLGAVSEELSENVVELMKSMGGVQDSTVIMGNVKLPMANAAFVNGIMGHVIEYDDGHKLGIAHPGAIVIPTALAVGEKFNMSGKDFILSVICGYEMMIRLAISVNPSHYKFFHTTGTCGAIAASVTSSKLMGLSLDKLENAIGISGTMSSGLIESFGTDAKTVNVGNACQSGVLASQLAEKGLTGAINVIGGDKGFFKAMSDEEDFSLCTKDLGKELLIDTAFYKSHASCGHTHPSLDMIIDILGTHDFDIYDIESIKVSTFKVAVDLTGTFKNDTISNAKFSIPYCIATALVFGKVTYEEFTVENLTNDKITYLKDKILVVEDVSSTDNFPKERKTTITIEFKDHKKIKKTIFMPVGNPGEEFLQKKYMSLSTMNISRKKAKEIMDIVLDLENCEKLDLLYNLLNNKN